ncbi:hypothetical protein TNCT_711141 [Trichonephila clavata]|uniref:Nitric oxide synthase-interacting protein zinc-finger domain-containing protein n=1 Tax=Trichonephila clavata TaxID=2740835 RepID=A0A8X6FLE7_TRICU|nr:hypothetical protein TNCT_711141 [Trichonephila clavata]
MNGNASNNIAGNDGPVRDFYCCSLTSQPCDDPVVTVGGFLYERSVVLEYISSQNKEIGKLLRNIIPEGCSAQSGSNIELPVPRKRCSGIFLNQSYAPRAESCESRRSH